MENVEDGKNGSQSKNYKYVNCNHQGKKCLMKMVLKSRSACKVKYFHLKFRGKKNSSVLKLNGFDISSLAVALAVIITLLLFICVL